MILTCTSLHHSRRSQHPLRTAPKRHKLLRCWLHIATAATLCIAAAAAACWLTLTLLQRLHYCWRLRQAVHRQLAQHGNIMRLQVSWRVVRQQREQLRKPLLIPGPRLYSQSRVQLLHCPTTVAGPVEASQHMLHCSELRH
jgi:hypothetical protein